MIKKKKWYLTHTTWKEYLSAQNRAWVGKGKITTFPRGEYLQEKSKSLRIMVGVWEESSKKLPELLRKDN